ncbi:p61 [Soybean leaf crinkle mottle virus]|nr:p61 [Soybean leaf crinkle mottle virus]
MTQYYPSAGYSWGTLFKKFYGEPDWKNYLSKAQGSYKPSLTNGINFLNGDKVSSTSIYNARSGTFEYELGLLRYSEKLFGWAKIVESDIDSILKYINDPGAFSHDEYVEVDVKSVGCRFTVDNVKEYLKTQEPSVIEHAWSLSNSCGELINPDDTSRFIELTFKNQDLITSTEAKVDNKISDYLVYCLTMYDASKKKSGLAKTQLYESYVKNVRRYLENTDLYYNKPNDNPLLSGMLYDMCSEYNIYSSSYKKNLEDFKVFTRQYLPLIEDVFEFSWLSPSEDERLLFEIEPYEILTEVPTMSIIDSTVVLDSKLKYLESYHENDPITAIEDKLEAIMVSSNPEISRDKLWISFFLYYGEYRTASSRVNPRPSVYKVPDRVGNWEVNFSQVEQFFDKLQRNSPSVSVRRRFCGAKAHESFVVFKTFNIGFPPITRLNVPQKYSYLNVDYYKFANRSYLSEDELIILSNVAKDIDTMCVERTISVKDKPIAQRKGLLVNHNRLRLNNKNTLVNTLWKNAGRFKASHG